MNVPIIRKSKTAISSKTSQFPKGSHPTFYENPEGTDRAYQQTLHPACRMMYLRNIKRPPRTTAAGMIPRDNDCKSSTRFRCITHTPVCVEKISRMSHYRCLADR
ncbi:hypothetical protein CEXT_663271 [Caerostris extrusa]|uniref:Uncharacterized protein n=1 Tax=Caerostris extrusa TaxID=172846 RepID=A0AAV4T2T6_CAEEX|nr:hypothetical protein CEXT_663271 [Caerostris extrusa]